jgi:hypothetical protein
MYLHSAKGELTFTYQYTKLCRPNVFAYIEIIIFEKNSAVKPEKIVGKQKKSALTDPKARFLMCSIRDVERNS